MRRARSGAHSTARSASERSLAGEAQTATAGVGEAEHRCVKTQTPPRIRLGAEGTIADDRMTQRRQLSADLSAPTGAQAQLEHGRARPSLANAVLGDRLAT